MPKREVKLLTGSVNFLGSGILHNRLLIFAPNFENTVIYVFDGSLKTSPGQISLPFGLANGTAFKPAGMP
jgi:hypothetical protein